jgi:hypothetical protein
MAREQFDIVDEDGSAIYRHRPTGFIGAKNHGGHGAGLMVTVRPASGSLARMIASLALKREPGCEFNLAPDPNGIYSMSQWVAGYDSGGMAGGVACWRTRGRQLLAGKAGSVSTPLANPVGAGADTAFLVAIAIPATLLHLGMRLTPRARIRKVGAAAAVTYKMNIGTAGNATDSLVSTVTTASSTVRDVILTSTLDVTGTGTLTSEGLSATNIDQAGMFSDLTTNINTAAVMTLSVSHNGNASDHFAIESLSLHLESLF